MAPMWGHRAGPGIVPGSREEEPVKPAAVAGGVGASEAQSAPRGARSQAVINLLFGCGSAALGLHLGENAVHAQASSAECRRPAAGGCVASSCSSKPLSPPIGWPHPVYRGSLPRASPASADRRILVLAAAIPHGLWRRRSPHIFAGPAFAPRHGCGRLGVLAGSGVCAGQRRGVLAACGDRVGTPIRMARPDTRSCGD